MGIGVSILLTAAGAILVLAVDASVAGIDVTAIGWILLIVGAIGTLLSSMLWSAWGSFARRDKERVIRTR
jgi:hypothetical protein